MKKTIGGNRLGAGKKMEVNLKTYDRSTHDLSYIWRSTAAAGTLIPFINELALPGDTFDIDLDADVKTHPTIGPLFGSYKLQLDVFTCPIRLYQGQLHNNKLGIGNNMAQVKLPLIAMDALNIPSMGGNIDNAQINPSSIFSYLGIRGVGRSKTEDAVVKRFFNAVPYLGYWDIYKNYYANKQEEIGAVIHGQIEQLPTPTVSAMIYFDDLHNIETNVPQEPATVNLFLKAGSYINILASSTVTKQNVKLQVGSVFRPIGEIYNELEDLGGNMYRASDLNLTYAGYALSNYDVANVNDYPIDLPQVRTFPLENIDNMRANILAHAVNNSAFLITQSTQAPYGWALDWGGQQTYFKTLTQEGLGLKTYQSDLFNNWLQTEWIDGNNGISAITAIDTSDGNFTIDTLNLSKKVYEMLNRIALSGGSYDDWLDTVYTDNRYSRPETPVYMGGLSKEIVFQEVISNSESSNGESQQPLGTLAGRGILSEKHKGGKVRISVDEPSYIIGIVSITPRVDYSQGNKWDVNLKTMDDLHKPALDEIGFQDLITDQMAWWDSATDVEGNVEFKSAGKQPAWINYMTNINRTYGNFAEENEQMWMTLNRRYEYNSVNKNIRDLTTYIDPMKFNHIFAQTDRTAQNFWVQLGVDITARRKMSAKIMPNL